VHVDPKVDRKQGCIGGAEIWDGAMLKLDLADGQVIKVLIAVQDHVDFGAMRVSHKV
jgi:hypothetical protein